MALQPLPIFDIKGRWGINSPFRCPPDQCIEAVNVEWWRSTLARKRKGSANITLVGGTANTGNIKWIFSWVPGENQGLRELWSLDSAATPLFKRLTGGSIWADVANSSGDAVTLADNYLTNGCQFNGKLHLAFNSPVNRSHVYDPAVGSIQRTGIAQVTTAPTVANTGGGAYPAIARYYKVVFVEILSGVVINCRSNPTSASTVFTPSGAGTAARVTRPAVPGEKETHWLVYGSADGANYYLLNAAAPVVIATTTYDDSVAPSAYSITGNAIPDSAAFNCPPSYKYMVADKAQLVMAGAYETAAGTGVAPSSRRVWWTSPIGATDEGDDQRISLTASIKNYTDVDQPVTALSSPQQGTIYIWSYRNMWAMVATGVANAPYVTYKITGARGCVEFKSVVAAEDENGNACTYWFSPQGPCRKGLEGGIISVTEDINDKWDLVGLDSTPVAHGVYHEDKHQIWWWIQTAPDAYPNIRVVFDTRLGRVSEPGVLRRGWATHTGSVSAWASCMHSAVLGANNSFNLKPYSTLATAVAIVRNDSVLDLRDYNGTTDINFESYILTRPYLPAGLGVKAGINEPACLAAEAATGANISLTAQIDFNSRAVSMGTKLLTATAGPIATPTHIFPRFDNSNVAMADSIQFRIGDALPLQVDASPIATWNLDAVSIPNTLMGNLGK